MLRATGETWGNFQKEFCKSLNDLKFYSVHSQIIVILIIQTDKLGENNQLSWISIEPHEPMCITSAILLKIS